MISQRVYCPRSVLRTDSQQHRWIVGWRSPSPSSDGGVEPTADTQMCIAASVDQRVEARSLTSVLRSLADHAALQTLWAHTGGAPEILGVLEQASCRDALIAPPNGASLHLRLENSSSAVPTLISSSAAHSQVVLFDAPAVGGANRFFSSANPFDAPGTVLVFAEDAVTPSAGSGPLCLSAEASGNPSPLEMALRQANATSATEKIIAHFMDQSDSSTYIPADFDFLALLTPRSRWSSAFTAALKAPFVLLWSCIVFLFFLCADRVMLPLLQLRVLSVGRLVESLFQPSMRKKVRVESVPLWQASYTLGAVYDKLQQALRARALHEGLARQRRALLLTPTIPSLRAEEELWGGVMAHWVEVRLGIAAGLAILALLGWFDGNVLPEPLQRHMPPWLFDSSALRSNMLVCPPVLLSAFHWISASFDALLSDSAPAGLKLNDRLHAQLARLMRQGVSDYLGLIEVSGDAISGSPWATGLLRAFLTILALSTVFTGISLLLAVAQDIVWVASLPLVILHGTLARLCAFTWSLLSSLWLLFRGEKRNVLRGGRVDSFPIGESYEHVLLGTLALACTVFLAPTVVVWHAMATSLRVITADAPFGILAAARGALRCAPLHLFSLWARDAIDGWRGAKGVGGKRIPAGIWLEVLPQGDAAPHTTYLALHSSPAPASTLLFRARTAMKRVMQEHPPGRVIRTLVWGSGGATNVPTSIEKASA